MSSSHSTVRGQKPFRASTSQASTSQASTSMASTSGSSKRPKEDATFPEIVVTRGTPFDTGMCDSSKFTYTCAFFPDDHVYVKWFLKNHRIKVDVSSFPTHTTEKMREHKSFDSYKLMLLAHSGITNAISLLRQEPNYEELYIVGVSYWYENTLNDTQIVVSGKCKTHETSEQVSVRELAEETGLFCDTHKLVHVQSIDTHGTTFDTYVLDVNECVPYDYAIHAHVVSPVHSDEERHRKIQIVLYGTKDQIDEKLKKITGRHVSDEHCLDENGNIRGMLLMPLFLFM